MGILVGSFIMLLAAGVIPADQDQWPAPPWVGAMAGAGFFFVGVSLTLSAYGVPHNHPLYPLLGCLAITALALVFNWAAFGPGERKFSGGVGGQTGGRIAFGAGAILLDVFALVGWSAVIRRLFRRA